MKHVSKLQSTEELSVALQSQLDLIASALDASGDGFAIWKPVRASDQSIEDFVLVLINRAGAEAANSTQAKLIGKTLTSVVGEATSVDLHLLFEKSLRSGHSEREVVPSISGAGLEGTFENTVVPFGHDLVLATYRDVSEEQRERTRLVWLTEHDFLTGMPNKARLLSELAKAVSMAENVGTLFGFAYIDIDHFKTVNDEHGHDVGDALLVNFVKRIRHSLPESALVARISGDEFAILLPEVKNEALLSELMDEVFASMQRPFKHGTTEIPVTCSAGCVVAGGSANPDEVMSTADKAMYRAKSEGRNRYFFERLGEAT